jgi:HlyD family secretion protein
MRKWLVRLVVLAVLAGGVVLLRATVLAPEPVGVEVAVVGRGRVESTVTNTRAGTVEARRRAQLSPEISGLVIELPFAEGAEVEAGAVLVRMDPTTQQAQLNLARMSLAAANARHAESCVRARRAERELERNEKLADEALISDDVLDQLASALEAARAACTSFEAQVAEAEAQVRVAESQLEKMTIRAPFAGVLAELEVELGEYVTPSPPGLPIPPVIDLIDTGSIHVSAPMDEVDSARLHAGLAARITLDPFPDASYEGRVARVAPYVLDVEEQNRTVEIEVVFADADFAATLLPGTSADVEVILEVKDDVLRIPTATLLEGRRVLAVEDGVLVDRPVTVGLRNWDWTEVTGGLEAGEQLVRSLGDTDVVPGARVVVAPPSPGPDDAP